MISSIGGRRSTNYDLACTYVAELDFDPGLIAPSEREQLVTSSGNRVKATPYDMEVNKGTVLSTSVASEGRLVDTYTHGGGAWEEELDLTYSIFPPSSMFAGIEPSFPQWDSDLASQATTQAMANARRGAVALPMLLKELPESIAMIGNRGKQALNAGTSMQNTWVNRYRLAKTPRQRRKIAASAANAHLEFLFGWTPFISETYELMKAVQTEKRTRVVGRGRSRRTNTTYQPPYIESQGSISGRSSCNGNDSIWYAYLSGDHVRIAKYEEEWRYRSSMTWEFSSKWSGDASKYGMNPVDALFDGFPLSFLLNFSTNVQDFLVANSPVVGGKFITGHVSMLSEGRSTIDVRSNLRAASFFPGSKIINLKPGEVSTKASKVKMTRVPFEREPDPEFALRSIFDLSRAGTMASLGVIAADARLRRALAKHRFVVPPPRGRRPPSTLPPIPYPK